MSASYFSGCGERFNMTCRLGLSRTIFTLGSFEVRSMIDRGDSRTVREYRTLGMGEVRDDVDLRRLAAVGEGVRRAQGMHLLNRP